MKKGANIMTNTINTNNSAIRTSNTPGTIAFILAPVSVAIWTFVGIEFFIIRDQMMNSIVMLAALIGLVPLIASFVFSIVGLCKKNGAKGLAGATLILDIIQIPVVALPTIVLMFVGLILVTVHP